MSTMLEQAIIDAAALRETAMKNAENALIEKYNKEFQETFNKLVEQDLGDSQPSEVAPETAAANAEDPTGPTVGDDSEMMDLGGNIGTTPEPQSKTFDKVKSAFFDLDGDDNEVITISFDGLKAKPVDTGSSMLASPGANLTPPPSVDSAPMMESLDEEIELELEEAYDMNGGNSSYGGHSSGVDSLEEEEELEEEIELEEAEELEEQEEPEATSPTVDPTSADNLQNAARYEKQAADEKSKAALKNAAAQKKAAAATSLEEEVELTEEELNELEESLMVDMQNVPEGYMGSHKKKAREMENIAYAEARDDKKKEKREYHAKRVQDLQESLKAEKTKSNELSELNKDLFKTIKTLKEHIEKMNLSNAKLLYTNKVLSDISLNERQKNHVVENITRSSSVTEAKTIYETLQSTVQSVKERVAPKSLSEVLNRGSQPFVARSKEPADNATDRLKLLAGIKKFD